MPGGTLGKTRGLVWGGGGGGGGGGGDQRAQVSHNHARWTRSVPYMKYVSPLDYNMFSS